MWTEQAVLMWLYTAKVGTSFTVCDPLSLFVQV